MKVYCSTPQDMPVANVSIGLYTDERGRPLIVADGKVIGTIKDVRDFIKRYEKSE